MARTQGRPWFLRLQGRAPIPNPLATREQAAPQPIILAGLSALAGRYDLLLCDVWGVIHNGREAFPAACEALTRWRRGGGAVTLISNSPRPSADVADQLDSLGAPRDAWSALVTSGDVTRELLAVRAPGPAWRIGPSRDDGLYDGLGLVFGGPTEAAFISCTGLVNDESESPEDYRQVLAEAAARGLEMICANPDRVVQRGERMIWCAGALADLYGTLGGSVRMAGKPFAPIYERCLRPTSYSGRSRDGRRVLAIGDGVATDIIGANRADLPVIFVGGGIHGGEIRDEAGLLDSTRAGVLLAASGARADYLMAELCW